MALICTVSCSVMSIAIANAGLVPVAAQAADITFYNLGAFR
jgi:hypothetical protein